MKNLIASFLILASASAYAGEPNMAKVRAAILTTEGTSESLVFLRPAMDERPDADQYAKLIHESYSRPMAGDPGIVLYQGNIFAEGYYRVVRLGNTNITTASLVEKEPWFEWNAKTNTYTKRYGHIAKTLLAPLIADHKVKLFRGLNAVQVEFLLKLKNGDADALNELYNKNRDAMFFTPDEASAKKWAKGYYIELTIDESDFDTLYAGIEYDYIEVAVPSKEVLQRAISTLKVTKVPAK